MAYADLLIKEVSEYLKHEDVEHIRAAVKFSRIAHQGQTRHSGDPYVTHPIAVARILTPLHLDTQSIIAALLHDVVEDTEITIEQIAEKFSQPVADLVEGLSKLERIHFETREDAQAENFRKMLLAMARDVRIILIKLADRLHNMRTLDSMRADKCERIARETMEIYAPIANRLGLNEIYQELQDLSFKHLHPNRYAVLAKALQVARGNRRKVLRKILDSITQQLEKNHIQADVTGREKNIYSIYKKMRLKSLAFSEVLDIYGFRVLVQDSASSYLALGILHALFKPIPGKFKDYIAIPKSNGYQSLHSTLFGPFGTPIEIQIRTHEMHKIADAGVASHWLYKNGHGIVNELHEKTHQWLQELLESLNDSRTSAEFMEHLKVDLFPDAVYVFTPKGRILSLPRGATAVDFAYNVHTDIGDRCIAVKVNHELVPLRSELRNGDRVEIITAPHAKPNPAWLSYVTTNKARSHIRHFLKTMQSGESAQLGERLLNQALDALDVKPTELTGRCWEKLLRDTGVKTRQEILTHIGLGRRLNMVVARQLVGLNDAAPSETIANTVITIQGTEGMAVQFATCCRPIPGDPIIGVIKSGQGLIVHTHDCAILRKAKNGQWLDVDWDKNITRHFAVNLKLLVANQRGVLAKIAAAISEADSNIENVSFANEGEYTALNFTLEVSNRKHLAGIMRSMRMISEVIRIYRVQNKKS
ncbi:MAG: bifunctional (p)ppGpp synthetase/guanosine-3',5'-bis(diphosphate) 3'-pyrophosphohydrolase [Gallionella sp.]